MAKMVRDGGRGGLRGWRGIGDEAGSSRDGHGDGGGLQRGLRRASRAHELSGRQGNPAIVPQGIGYP
jgi:hypothetical protein